MSGEPGSAGRPTLVALRVLSAFAAALALASALDLHATYIAPLAAASLALTGTTTLKKALAVPLLFWALVWGVALLTELWAAQAPLAYVTAVLAGLYGGYRLCARGGTAATLGYVALIAFAETPMRFMAQPELTALIANDLGKVALVGTLCAWLATRLFPGQPGGEQARPSAPLPPLTAALVTLLGAWLVWTLQPPAAGALIISIILVLRANPYSAAMSARHRATGTLVGGVAAVLAALLIQYAHNPWMLFLALMVVGWPIAWQIGLDGPGKAVAIKALNALGLLVGQGLSTLIEADTATLLWERIVAVFLGLAFALLAWTLLARDERTPTENPARSSGAP